MKSIRAAFSYFKKNFKRRLHKDWQYHLYPLNHARFWNFKDDKWKIGSWYNNHRLPTPDKKKEKSEKMQKALIEKHQVVPISKDYE